MTLSEIRRRVDALKRKFARELAIIKLRRIAEDVADDWDPDDPPNPPTSSGASPTPASASPPSPASTATSRIPAAKAMSPSLTPSSSISSLGQKTTATANSSAGTFPPLPHSDDHCPKRLRVRARCGG